MYRRMTVVYVIAVAVFGAVRGADAVRSSTRADTDAVWQSFAYLGSQKCNDFAAHFPEDFESMAACNYAYSSLEYEIGRTIVARSTPDNAVRRFVVRAPSGEMLSFFSVGASGETQAMWYTEEYLTDVILHGKTKWRIFDAAGTVQAEKDDISGIDVMNRYGVDVRAEITFGGEINQRSCTVAFKMIDGQLCIDIPNGEWVV